MWAKARAVGNVYSRCPRAAPVRASASSTCPRPAFALAGVVLLWVGSRWPVTGSQRPVAGDRWPVTGGRCCVARPAGVWGAPALFKLADLSLNYEEVGPPGA
jgi:hypothetical protein